MRTRDRQRQIKAAQEGIQACQEALRQFPNDPVFTRSLRHWERVLRELNTITTAPLCRSGLPNL